jgi:hypothetical protein
VLLPPLRATTLNVILLLTAPIQTTNSSLLDVLTPANNIRAEWVALGFGPSMVGSDMVILWPNQDGSITLSQRYAAAYSEPRVVQSPPRVAFVSSDMSSTSGAKPQYAFTIPADSNPEQNLVYAIGTTNPGSSDPSAHMQIHAYTGQMRLNLSKPIASSDGPTSGAGSGTTLGHTPEQTHTVPTNEPVADSEAPLRPYERIIIAHALFSCIGFLILLPVGSLIARYLRTFSPTWFKAHWIIQFGASAPFIVIGLALGVQAVNKSGALHLNDPHMKLGVVLFLFYFVQSTFGWIIHTFKSARNKKLGTRPIQNYLHAVFGLLIIFLALAQVHNGLTVEWPNMTGRGKVPQGLMVWWYVWVVGFPSLYAAGLYFLPKQLKQERVSRQEDIMDDMKPLGDDLPRVGGDYRQYHP